MLSGMMLPHFCWAQRIDNVQANVIGDKVIVSYDIAAAAEGQKFKVSLYASHDGYTSPLNLITGDAGLHNELLAGYGKRIEWNAKSELKEFDGEITFEIRAQVLAAPLRVIGPAIGARHKRGKSMDIQWKGGMPADLVKLELLKGGSVVSQIGEISNTTSYTWTIPKKITSGADYQVKLTASGTVVTSDIFKIKKRTPLIVKALPVFAAGAIAFVILSNGGGPGSEDPVERNELPSPPEPE